MHKKRGTKIIQLGIQLSSFSHTVEFSGEHCVVKSNKLAEVISYLRKLFVKLYQKIILNVFLNAWLRCSLLHHTICGYKYSQHISTELCLWRPHTAPCLCKDAPCVFCYCVFFYLFSYYFMLSVPILNTVLSLCMLHKLEHVAQQHFVLSGPSLPDTFLVGYNHHSAKWCNMWSEIMWVHVERLWS